MKNTFEKVYARQQEIKAQYRTAQAASNEEGIAQAQSDYAALKESIQAEGRRFASIYNLYEGAMNVGNRYLDISEAYQYTDEAELVASLREYGIEAFTFSSGWSSAVDSAWAFVQNGCTLQGMVQINAQHVGFDGDEYEKRSAFLFNVQ